MEQLDPLAILDLPVNYTIDMLRNAYKRVALKAHPDKGGSEYLFKVVTQCYRYLLADLKKREADKQFHELKKEFLKETQQQQPQQKQQSAKTVFYNGSRFDPDKFNKFFMDNRFVDEVHEQGYKEWMESQDIKQTPKYKGSYNAQGFNQQFEKNTQVSKNNKHLIKYKEPEALVASKRLGFTELGQDSIDDFSGDNKSLKHLNYMDYRLAHTTSRMVDPSTVNDRPEFRNIQELERTRENVSYQMNEMELREYQRKIKAQQKLDERRQSALRSYDERLANHYSKINGLLTS
jgi:curved DNA-binding protein CbpA